MTMRTGADEIGFTLIEVLVAVTIAAVLMVALLRSFSGGIAGTVRADDASEATSVAESGLESLGTRVALRDGLAAHYEEGQFSVAESAQLYRPAETAGDIRLYDVAVTVSWRAGTGIERVTLRTLKPALRR